MGWKRHGRRGTTGLLSLKQATKGMCPLVQCDEDLQSNRAGAVDLTSTLCFWGVSLKTNSSLVPWTWNKLDGLSECIFWSSFICNETNLHAWLCKQKNA